MTSTFINVHTHNANVNGKQSMHANRVWRQDGSIIWTFYVLQKENKYIYFKCISHLLDLLCFDAIC